MAIPIAQTSAKIALEGLKKVGISSPTAEQQTRAEEVFLREILGDICTSPGRSFNNRLKSLQSVSTQISTVGLSKYSVPTDFDEEISITILDGTHTGTATAGGASTITLAAAEDATEEEAEGNYILITSGTGSAQLRQITDYNTTTLVVTVDTAWTTTPDATSVYLIVDEAHELEDESIIGFSGIGTDFSKGLPSSYNKVSEAGAEYFILDKPTDKATYGIMTRYYAEITKVDEDSDTMARINRLWYNVLVNGVAAKVAEDEDDSKYQVYKSEYERLKVNLLAKETPYGVEFDGFTV